jgi:hypothetical protein
VKVDVIRACSQCRRWTHHKVEDEVDGVFGFFETCFNLFLTCPGCGGEQMYDTLRFPQTGSVLILSEVEL